MSVTRDIPFVVRAMPDTMLATCSALVTTGSTGVVSPITDTTADALLTPSAETTGFGRVIDRLRQPIGARYTAAVVGSYIHSSRGSTEADRKLTIGVKLQHGDSSAGGDMVDYSTANQPATRQYFSTARSTDAASWDGSESTGEIFAASNPGYYDLRAAKRYVRIAVPVFKNRVTTESSGDEQSRVGGDIAFMSADRLPQLLDTTGPYSTTTST
jgi:hypothetical protein